MKLRRMISALLILTLVIVCFMDATVFAAPTASGSCGESCKWSYESGKLQITGSGAMEDYANGFLPWQNYLSSITAVEIQKGISVIGNYAFSGCANLKTVTLPAGLQVINDGAFLGCTKLQTLILPDGLKTIGNFAFEGSGITDIRIPETVKKLGGYAFNGCRQLTDITIPKSVTEIGDYTFQDCTKLRNIQFVGTMASIGEGAFQNCTALQKIVLPNGLKKICDDAFYGCNALTQIVMPDGLNEVGSFVFGNCGALTKVVFPDSVVSIGENLFFNCGNLEEVHLPEALKTLRSLMFFNCSKLERIDIPKSVATVDSNAFSYCENLSVVTFAGKMPSFDANAFYGSKVFAFYPVGDGSWKSLGQYGGKITWQGHYLNAVSMEIEVSHEGAYPCGSKFPEGDVEVTVLLRDGSKVTLPRELYTVENWSSASAGERTIRIRHGKLTEDYTFVFHKKVHITPNSNSYPQSEHDYLPNIDEEKTFFYPGAQTMTLFFSLETKLGEGDTLTLYLSDGMEWMTFRGNEASGIMFTIPGDSFTIRLVSDDADCNYGYSFETIEVDALLHTQEKVPGKAPTCDEPGYSEKITCKSCGQQLKSAQVIPALGHDWGAYVETVKPDMNNDGIQTRTCNTCGGTENQTIDNNPFTDVKADRFEAGVLWAYYSGITTGTGDGTTFSPENACTRKQIVTFLWRAAGEPEPKSMINPFTDVESDRFEKAILWAYYEGITAGTGDGSTFSPEATCTRKQIVTFLWRYHGEPAPESSVNSFTDVKTDRFTTAILWAAEQGITTGTGDGSTFSPEDPCTRKQIVTFLYRDLNS